MKRRRRRPFFIRCQLNGKLWVHACVRRGRVKVNRVIGLAKGMTGFKHSGYQNRTVYTRILTKSVIELYYNILTIIIWFWLLNFEKYILLTYVFLWTHCVHIHGMYEEQSSCSRKSKTRTWIRNGRQSIISGPLFSLSLSVIVSKGKRSYSTKLESRASERESERSWVVRPSVQRKAKDTWNKWKATGYHHGRQACMHAKSLSDRP